MDAWQVSGRLLGGEPFVVATTAREFLLAASLATRDATTEADRALLAGRLADRLGFAFAAGYQAALRKLLGERLTAPTCLAATEEGGAHPRAIRTSLSRDESGLVLDGEKIWTTLAEESELVLVFAREGEVDGRPSLRAVLVPTSRTGVTRERMPETPFAPEVHHARLRLARVRVEPAEVLPGDAYVTYLKPFRTIEDAHVACAAIGHFLGLGRAHGFDRAPLERLLARALAARAVAEADTTAAETHVALGGVFAALDSVAAALGPSFDRAPVEVRERWERDRHLLRVANKARTERLARAWEQLGR